MRGREMLDTIENLNPAYIEAAAETPKVKKKVWLKLCNKLLLDLFIQFLLRFRRGDD